MEHFTLSKRRGAVIGLFFLFVLVLSIAGTYLVSADLFNSQFQVFYSLDKQQNDQQIIKVINGAQSYVYFAIYMFTKENIAEALIEAKKRGLTVLGITDRGNSTDPTERPILEKLRKAGITVEVQKHPQGIMHIKAVVTDNAYAMGSYNWTSAATYENDELLEVSTDQDLRRRYLSIIKNLLIVNE